MHEKILLFKPRAKGYFKKSLLYALPIFIKTLGICARYFGRSLNKKLSRQETDEYIDVFWRAHFQESYTKLYAVGREYLVSGETYVFMSNHESWMDIPAMFGAVPMSLRMVSKEGLMRVPIVGHAMVNAGFIAIDRKNKTRAIKQLDHAKERLSEGISVWIAPEGTRSRDGSLLPFKKGGFHVARELKKSIVPVFIEGSRHVLAADSLVVNTNRSITVHFLQPIHFEEFEHLTVNHLVDMVRKAIMDKKAQIEGNQE